MCCNRYILQEQPKRRNIKLHRTYLCYIISQSNFLQMKMGDSMDGGMDNPMSEGGMGGMGGGGGMGMNRGGGMRGGGRGGRGGGDRNMANRSQDVRL